MGKANSPASVPHTFPLTAPAPRPELLLLLCAAEWPLLPPLDVRCRLEALDEKELTSPRSPEVSDEPPAVLEEDMSVSHSWHSTTGSSVSLKETKRGLSKMMQVLDASQSPVQSTDTFMKLMIATQTSVWANPWQTVHFSLQDCSRSLSRSPIKNSLSSVEEYIFGAGSAGLQVWAACWAPGVESPRKRAVGPGHSEAQQEHSHTFPA